MKRYLSKVIAVGRTTTFSAGLGLRGIRAHSRRWERKSPRRPLALLLVVALGFCLSARRAEPSGGDDPFAYTFAFIQSLRGFHLAASYYPQEPDPMTLGGLMDLMRASRLAQGEYFRAAASLAAFRGSNVEMIRMSAEAAYTAYTRLIEIDRQLIQELENNYKASHGAAQSFDAVVQAAKRGADLSARKQEALKLLLWSVAPATWALVQLPEKKDERLSRLTITAEGRRALVEALETFGPTIKKYVEDDPRAAPAPAVQLYEFLSRPGWKASDAK